MFQAWIPGSENRQDLIKKVVEIGQNGKTEQNLMVTNLNSILNWSEVYILSFIMELYHYTIISPKPNL